jgi:hypothetical protein
VTGCAQAHSCSGALEHGARPVGVILGVAVSGVVHVEVNHLRAGDITSRGVPAEEPVSTGVVMTGRLRSTCVNCSLLKNVLLSRSV